MSLAVQRGEVSPALLQAPRPVYAWTVPSSVVDFLGFKWGIRFNGLLGTNTCSLDTALAAFYLCNMYLLLPDTNITALHVFNLIAQGKLDEARFKWYTKMMSIKIPPKKSKKRDLTQNLHDGITSCFTEKLPDIFEFVTEHTSKCISCGREVQKVYSSAIVLVPSENTINDKSVEEALTDRNLKWTPSEWTCPCGGVLRENKYSVLREPVVLTIEVHANNKLGLHAAETLNVFGKEFKLRAIIHKRGLVENAAEHFTVTTFQESKTEFYDGMKERGNRILWSNGISEAVKEGGKISEAWYTSIPTADFSPKLVAAWPGVSRDKWRGRIIVPAHAHGLDIASSSTVAKHISKNTKQIIETLNRKDNITSTPNVKETGPTKTRRRGIAYPLGVSVTCGTKGPAVTCRMCSKRIKKGRGLPRLVLHEPVTPERRWPKVWQYHFDKNCVPSDIGNHHVQRCHELIEESKKA